MIYLLLIGCSKDSVNQAAELSTEIAFFHALEEGKSWTYKDDGLSWEDTGFSLNEEVLIRAEYLGEGVVEFRRGVRWTDGVPIANLTWDTSNGLALSAWDVPVGQGSGDCPLSGPTIAIGESTSGDWSCIASDPEGGVETYYALFEHVVVFDCIGGLEGQYVFGYETGLVKMTLTDFTLELVAPW